MKISFCTLGCKLNQAETHELKNKLFKAGFSVVPYDTAEHIAIIRACAVTGGASRRTRQMIRRIKQKGIHVIATGCLENKDLAEIDFIGKNNAEILTYVKNNFEPRKSQKQIKNNTNTRLRLKIQDGCNFSCAYCIIPCFRGKSFSISHLKVLEQVQKAGEGGYKEIILTGVNVCQYNHNGLLLPTLLQTILDQTDIERIRLGSTDPRLITDELISVYKNPRLLPHTHLSLQSGSNTVLQRMNRNYTAENYNKIVQKCKKNHPYFSFTTDVIVGFPGETDKEFEESVNFVKKIEFAKVHVFPYSPRPGTTAANMKNQVQDNIKKARVKKLIKISKQVRQKFYKKLTGQKRKILFEGKRNGFWEGYTPEFVRIKLKSDKNLENKTVMVELRQDMLA